MSITIKDVAKRCGMSISTVSKVFNGYPDISEETRQQVMRRESLCTLILLRSCWRSWSMQ